MSFLSLLILWYYDFSFRIKFLQEIQIRVGLVDIHNSLMMRMKTGLVLTRQKLVPFSDWGNDITCERGGFRHHAASRGTWAWLTAPNFAQVYLTNVTFQEILWCFPAPQNRRKEIHEDCSQYLKYMSLYLRYLDWRGG